MDRTFTAKALLSVTTSLIISGALAAPAQAQSLYAPYYYQQREQFQTMTSTHLRDQHVSTPDVSGQVNYVPDSRLNPQTNKRLAEGDYPPVPTSIKPKLLPEPSNIPMGTIPGIDFGVQATDYQYKEPSVGVSITGYKLGINPTVTALFGERNQYFGTIDFRYAFGQVDYSGSGSIKNEDDNLWELRGVVGRDFVWNDKYDLSPYGGFGYRQLFNDGRGSATVGNITYLGYRRESQYLYIPVGVTPRVRINADSRLEANFEYDYFVHGQQKSYLHDTGLGEPDVNNQQDTGYGIKMSLMYENNGWMFGPFYNYWNIHQSKANAYGFEPPNNTQEYGLQLKYRFVTF